jgi:hypothetical protein
VLIATPRFITFEALSSAVGDHEENKKKKRDNFLFFPLPVYLTQNKMSEILMVIH